MLKYTLMKNATAKLYRNNVDFPKKKEVAGVILKGEYPKVQPIYKTKCQHINWGATVLPHQIINHPMVTCRNNRYFRNYLKMITYSYLYGIMYQVSGLPRNVSVKSPALYECSKDWYTTNTCAQLTLHVLNFSRGTLTYIYILCHFSTLIRRR